VPFEQLVLALAVNRASAVLEMKRTPLEKQIVFDEGAPVECISNVATETLGRYMVSLGRLTESEYHAVPNASIGQEVPFEELLVEHSLVNPTDLHKLPQPNPARQLPDPVETLRSRFGRAVDDATETASRAGDAVRGAGAAAPGHPQGAGAARGVRRCRRGGAGRGDQTRPGHLPCSTRRLVGGSVVRPRPLLASTRSIESPHQGVT